MYVILVLVFKWILSNHMMLMRLMFLELLNGIRSLLHEIIQNREV